MLQIEPFDYMEENDSYFAEASLNGVSFGILVDAKNGDIYILGNLCVSHDEMEKKVKPYFEVIAKCVAEQFGLI